MGEAKKVKRPSSVRIGHADYPINYYSEADWLAGPLDNNSCGLYEAVSSCIHIRLSPGCTEQHLREVLLHEVLHGVWYHQNARELDVLGDEAEEKIVGTLALELIAVLQQNPKVMKWLTATNRHE
jgi:hypothetical protein